MKPDLNLLVVLDALCRTGSVSKASDSLGLSQPAVSHALNRLRAATGDPLFTRSGRGLVPTPRALALSQTAAGIVAAGQSCLRPEAFDPETDAAQFRIGVSDYAGMVLLPRLVADLRQRSPGASVTALAVGRDALREMETGRMDLSFWGTEPPGAPFLYLPLYQEHFVLALRRDHPVLSDQPLTWEGYLGLCHAVVSLGDPGQSPVDAALAQRGARRRIVLTSASFAANMAAVATSDLVATIPARLAAALPDGVVARPLPLALMAFDYGLTWHPRTDAAPALRWLRERIVETAAEGSEP